MTFQMYLLEMEMEAEKRGEARSEARGLNKAREAFSLKLIRRDRTLDEIQEDTELPLERLKQLVKETTQS